MTCEEVIEQHMTDRLADIRELWRLEQSGEEDPDLGTLNEYGLYFDWVEANTFCDQEQGFWRYQLSWGGPQDEFRAETRNGIKEERLGPIHYHFMKQYDGAKRRLNQEDYWLVLDVMNHFRGY